MDRLDGREPDGFRQRLEAAIAEERRESVAADASAERAMGTIRAAAQVYAIGSIALLLSLVWFFVRRIREPFEELMAGTEAMRAGDRTRRIRVRSSDEFGLIGTSVNAMSDEVDRHRRELEAAHGRLEATVAQRTEQLRVANDGLLKADARRRQLFADISHELRTPLTAIRGEAEIALRGGPKPADDYRVALQQITDVSGQLGRLVDDLLFISRNDAGVHALRMEPVPMGALLQSVCQQGRAIGHARSIDVVHEPLREDAIVLGDRDRLRQLFMILIDNAIRYTPGTTPVVVSAAQDAGRLVVRVADQGVGIPEDALSEVFRRFYRGDRSATQGGTGLGLPIAKAIAESHGGTIEIRSTPNVGTTVVVSLAHAGPAAEAA
jgi:signal transduction histidine kinase